MSKVNGLKSEWLVENKENLALQCDAHIQTEVFFLLLLLAQLRKLLIAMCTDTHKLD